MDTKRGWLIVGLALSTIGQGACNGGSESEAKVAAPKTPGPAVETVAPNPPATVDPFAGIRETVAVVESGDASAIVARIRLSPIPCMSDAWPQPECAAGVAEGTPIQRFAFVGCEPAFLTGEELTTVVTQVVARRAPVLELAAEVHDTGSALFPTGPWAAVFRTNPPQGVASSTGVLVVMDAVGSIISLRTECRASPAELADGLSVKRLLPSARASP